MKLPAFASMVSFLGLFGACAALDDGPLSATAGGSAGQSTASGSAGLGGTNSGGSATFGGGGSTAGSAGSAAGVGGTAQVDAVGGGAAGLGGVGGSTGGSAAGQPAGGSSTCVTSGSELCEDFEAGALDLKKWSITKPTASADVAVDTTRPHRGTHSLHIKVVPGSSSTAQIADALTFPAESNTFYTRAFFYFSPDLPADNNGGFHMAYLLATGNNDLGFVEAGLGSAGNKQYLGYSEYYGAGPGKHEHGPTFTEFGPRSNLQVVPMQWLCLELMQGGDATTTTRRVWVDGSELTEQKSNYSERKPPTFELVSIGVLQYHPTPLLSDVWVDDIRVSKAPIGCDK
jgi:hypothetical protein